MCRQHIHTIFWHIEVEPWQDWFNSLISGRKDYNLKSIIFELRVIAWVLAVKLLPGECHRTSLTRNQYWLQVMACCRQATSHYKKQRWAKSMPLYNVTSPNKLIVHAAMFNRPSLTRHSGFSFASEVSIPAYLSFWYSILATLLTLNRQSQMPITLLNLLASTCLIV